MPEEARVGFTIHQVLHIMYIWAVSYCKYGTAVTLDLIFERLWIPVIYRKSKHRQIVKHHNYKFDTKIRGLTKNCFWSQWHRCDHISDLVVDFLHELKALAVHQGRKYHVRVSLITICTHKIISEKNLFFSGQSRFFWTNFLRAFWHYGKFTIFEST
jgi:hypothetical protein